MTVNKDAYLSLKSQLQQENVQLVAVSKTKPVSEIMELYHLGQRSFGENYVQELMEKQSQLPHDIDWHFIGHLQTNKVKYLVPFVSLIQGVDSLRLLREINKQAEKANKVLGVLLQVHIAREETKFGFDASELQHLWFKHAEALQQLKNVHIKGLMGMASLTTDDEKIRSEFRALKQLFDAHAGQAINGSRMSVLSMGMSSDYKIAVQEGSTMVRVGSLLFGARSQNNP